MLDLKIVNGTVVDGTGEPGMLADVGIRDGRIVAVGMIAEAAKKSIDASGRVVAPGFIDVHTHYDAQAFWDPTLSPSCFHGVTTIVGGMCGFSIAPMTPEAATYIRPMLARVEGMPLKTLEAGAPWTWSSFGDYLGLLEGKIGLNAGFFCGHSAIRRIAMGARAVGEKASTDELERMKGLLAASLAEGALGFSTTISPTHNDGDGRPVPSRWADYSEILALGRVCRDYEGTGLELLPNVDFGPGIPELLADFSLAGQRPVNWNVLAVTGAPDAAERAARQLAVSDFARERGAEVIALTVPCTPEIYMNFSSGFVFDSLPGIWRQIFQVPVPERIKQLRDPEVRRRLATDAAAIDPTSQTVIITKFGNYTVVAVKSDKNKHYVGRKTGRIAAEQGRDPLELMLDIALDDDLLTTFAPDLGGHDQATYELRGRLWHDDRTLIGASDAGAHLDMIDTFAFSTTVLQKGVREHKVITLEEAVRQITGIPAQFLGLIDRGLLAPGYHADVVIFDPDTVARGPTYFRNDVPGDEFRIYADAIGVDHVFVNGTQIVRDGKHTGVLPGTVLHSGRDTRTVRLDVMRTESRRSARFEKLTT
jgi:N-acyl-D-aspartate/D-glutamate deacylase